MKFALLLLLSSFTLSVAAHANSIYNIACSPSPSDLSGPSGSLGYLGYELDYGDGCDATSSDFPGESIGYYGFAFSATQQNAGEDTLLGPADIGVEQDDGFGLTFSGFNAYPVSSDNVVTYTLLFDIDPPPVLGGDSLGLDPLGDVTGTVYYCPGTTINLEEGGGTVCGDSSDPLMLGVANSENEYYFDNSFNGGPYSTVGIEVVLTLAGDPPDLSTVDDEPDLIMPEATPEPAAAWLVGTPLIGLAALYFLRKKPARS